MYPSFGLIMAIYPNGVSMIDREFDSLDFSRDFKSTLLEMDTDTFYHETTKLKD